MWDVSPAPGRTRDREPGTASHRGETTLSREIAREIGRYRILSELGRGSTGCVYLAVDPNIERKVALKVFSPDSVDSELVAEFQRRFVTEAKAAGRLSHPGIVTVYDTGTDDSGASYIAMEWVEGQTLHEYLWKNGGRLSAATAADVVRQVALALDYAHREGVVHRDVKPANVLVGKDGRIRVMDFGVAKLARHDLTTAGVVLGTPAFMSPEQIRAEKVDGRSDLFSLGTILYECLTGTNPFAADSLTDVTFKILNEDVVPPRSLDPKIPADLSEVAVRAVCKAPEDRFQSGAEMARALAAPAAAEEPALAAFDDLGDLEDLPPLDSTVISGVAGAKKGRASSPYLAWTAATLLLAAGLWALVGRPSPASFDEGSVEVPAGEPVPASPVPGPRETVPVPAEPETTAEEGRAEPAGRATLDVLYVNRLREGRVSLRIDGVEAWSQEVGAKNPLKRLALGKRHHIALPVDAGARSIEVRITAPTGVDARKTIHGTLKAGTTRQLQVTLRRRANEIELDWAD